jgi:DNA-3-methyladenine glycosylase
MELEQSFFDREVVKAARDLIGCALRVDAIGGIIVETEAYSADEQASHSFAGISVRNKSMFGPSGHAYVYRSYGIHWCLNFVCRPGSAVLIRALEPKWGLHLMEERRRIQTLRLLCAGPGRVGEALGIAASHDGLNLFARPFQLSRSESVDIVAGTRIGISKAVEHQWRFGMKNSPFLSRKF